MENVQVRVPHNYYLMVEYEEDGQDLFRVLEGKPDDLRKYKPQKGESVTLLRRRA